MATDIRALRTHLNDDAQFRTWIDDTHAQLIAAGLVQVTSTGELAAPAAATKPAATNTAAGFRMYRFTDSLQATAPVFIKVEWGVGFTVNVPSLWITVGNAHDGAGVLTGIMVGTRRQVAYTTSADAAGTTRNGYASGSSSRLSWAPLVDTGANAHGLAVMVERLKDASGTPIADSIYTAFLTGNAAVFQMLTPGLAPLAGVAQLPALGIQPAAAGHTPNVGSDLAVCPHMIAFGQWRYALPLSYRTIDIADLSTFTLTHLGASHVYLPIGSATPSSAQVALPAAGMALALPWE